MQSIVKYEIYTGMDERTNKRTNERTNERTDERTDGRRGATLIRESQTTLVHESGHIITHSTPYYV